MRRAQVIGAAFDGNIHSLGGNFGFDDTQNRCVVVSTAAITEALWTKSTVRRRWLRNLTSKLKEIRSMNGLRAGFARCASSARRLRLLAAALNAGAARAPPEENVLRATLPNGLRVIIVRNTLAPVVATAVNYLAGWR